MDREIKFRAWDKRTKRMYPDVELAEIRPTMEFRGWSLNALFIADWIELLQYIGYNDRKGVEVYEGDLYTFDGPRKKKREIAVVRDIRSFFEEKGLAEGEYGWDYSKIEVVGNIYENPDFLKSTHWNRS